MATTQHSTLVELLEKGLQYDSSWAIYAYGKNADAPARVGQTQFEQGGLMDGMDKIIDGVQLGDAILVYTDGDLSTVEHIIWGDFIEWLQEEGYLDDVYPSDCYDWENRCPQCNGVVFGADFPNGDGHGGCLNCGVQLAWNDDSEEWEIDE